MKRTRRRSPADTSSPFLPPPAPLPEAAGLPDDLRLRIAELGRGVEHLLRAVKALPPARVSRERESA